MRTVSGIARRFQLLGRRWRPAVVRAAAVRPLAAGRSPLLSDRIGDQRRGGVVLDQMDGTTCGSAVLVALAAWADPTETRRLDGPVTPSAGDGRAAVGERGIAAVAPAGVSPGFSARYDARQKQVHRESAGLWPRLFGTPPWGMVRWLRRNVPSAGPYRVRLVDDLDARDVADVVEAIGVALRAGRPVPMLVGPSIPRHYVMAIGMHGAGWKVYEPSSGQIRALDPARIAARTLGGTLGFDRLHAAFLPS